MKINNRITVFLVIFILMSGILSAQGPAFKTRLFGTNFVYYLQLMWNEAGAANRVLNFLVNGDDRDINLSGDFTLSGDNQVSSWSITGLTDGFIPYHVSDATGLADSGLFWDGAQLGIGTAAPAQAIDILGNLILAQNKTATTAKNSVILAHQYDIAAEPEGFILISDFADNTVNRIDIGGRIA